MVNKKLNLEELKELVFNKNQATKQNKDRLFKLSKSSEDIETIKKLANDLEFKSAKIYLGCSAANGLKVPPNFSLN